jgi:hypothetical protein
MESQFMFGDRQPMMRKSPNLFRMAIGPLAASETPPAMF